ncbi:probable bifunctional dTTP/UTP pyrophosphatase/methyltransferase protein [Centruroides vittatus]|uniref:probable bifunctional dTTP/UTP pyrophosphatase/methyltransferase protein n=1 Tax=Centruroides vittatus TaxID=120091 RepID=UPI00350EB9FC
MLQPILHKLATQRIVLASGSPRREQILKNINLKFEVIPSTFEENLDKSSFEKPYEFVKETAKCKALQVAEKLKLQKTPADLVIGADTIVTLDGRIFEKPKNEDDAFQMLQTLSGRTHTVYTGVVFVIPSNQNDDCEFITKTFHEATHVTMSTLTEDMIKYYIKTKEPMDKAGAYGIQEIGGTIIEGIQGDYFTVMGLPIHRLCKELVQLYKDMKIL